MDRFTVEILPVVVRFAELCFRCPDKQSLALTMAWYAWFTAKPDQQSLPPSVWARAGVRRVVMNRDLPAIGTSARDALNRTIFCGPMDGLADARPGPEQLAMDRERYEAVLAGASARERFLIDCFESGMKAGEVAAELGVSPARVTQIRQGLMDADE